jgi:hypothetical protein
MRAAFCSIVVAAFAVLPARADLTIVYSTAVEPVKQAQKPQQAAELLAAATNMMIRVKGDKARIDASPLITAIFDGTTGELINVSNDQKTVVRVPPDRMRAIADTLNKGSNNKQAPARPKLVPTGQREMIGGYDTEQYTYDGPDFKATYWIAPNYPNGAVILAQLQSIKSELWDAANTKMPDFRDFPGLPLRMRVIVGKQNHEPVDKGTRPEHPAEITSTVTAVSLDPIPDTQFTVPADFKEANLPNVLQNASPTISPNP